MNQKSSSNEGVLEVKTYILLYNLSIMTLRGPRPPQSKTSAKICQIQASPAAGYDGIWFVFGRHAPAQSDSEAGEREGLERVPRAGKTCTRDMWVKLNGHMCV